MGAALVMHGIRSTTSDIDLGCSSTYFDELAQSESVYFSGEGRPKIRISSEVTIYRDWALDHPPEVLDELRVASLHDILRDKMRLNRPKDRPDIEALIRKTREI